MESLQTIIIIIGISGTFGGFVFGLFSRKSYQIVVPFSGHTIELGALGDVLIGLATSFSVFFFAAPLFNLHLQEIKDADGYIKLISIGLISGFAGIKLLSGMSSKFIERIYEV